jgi:phosphopantetheinyl transferase
MALLARIEWDEGHRMAFWKDDTSAEEVLAELGSHPDDARERAKINHPKRLSEWAVSRAALRVGLSIDLPVLYHPNGKPYLKGQELSLSHCLPIAGALVHPEFAGMDIQSPDPKLEKIKQKFAHPEELDFALKSADALDALTILWSSKEALFKVYGQEKAFADQLRVDPFTPGQDELSARVEVTADNWVPHRIRCFRIENHWVLVVKSIG